MRCVVNNKVIPIGCVTYLDLPVDTILDGAKNKLSGVVIMGYDNEGNEYFASTYADGGEVLWLLEQLKKKLLETISDD